MSKVIRPKHPEPIPRVEQKIMDTFASIADCIAEVEQWKKIQIDAGSVGRRLHYVPICNTLIRLLCEEQVRDGVERLGAVQTERLTTLINEAIGAASMCWDPLPGNQVFDSKRAGEIAEKLLADLSSSRQWLPIEGAPRDGRLILIRFGSDWESKARWCDRPDYPWQFADNSGSGLFINYAKDGPGGGPSHWRPI